MNDDRLNIEADAPLQATPQDDVVVEARKRRDEQERAEAHQAFWSVRDQNPKKQRIKALRRTLPYARTRYVRDGYVVQDGKVLPAVRIVRVRVTEGLSGRQWRRLRKDLNREAKRRAEQSPVELPT